LPSYDNVIDYSNHKKEGFIFYLKIKKRKSRTL